MTRPRLRTLVLIPLVVALVATSAIMGVVIHRRVEMDLTRGVDSELQRAMLPRALAGNGPMGPTPGEPAPPPPDGSGTTAETPDDAPEQLAGGGPQVVVIDDAGEVVEIRDDSDDLASRDLTGLVGSARATLDGEPRLRALAVPVEEGRLVIATSFEAVDDSLSSLRRNLFIGIGALVLVQAAIAALLIRLVNRPLNRLSSSAHQIAAGDLDTPIDATSGPRETAQLGSDLQVMVDRLTTTIAEREAAAAEAEQARAATARFMADVSHELRTPLTAIKGYADLHIAGMLGDDEVGDAMARISDESERLTDLVGDLLQLLRPTDNRHVEPVDLAAIASAAVHDLRAAHPDHPISLDLHDDCTVLADPARVHQAGINLGANACQHTPPRTPIEMRIERRGDDGRLSVTDEGPGIDPEIAARVLQPFVRGDAARSRASHDGSGLGLAITDRIARQHDGSVELDSTPGHGTTFTLSLPVAPG